MNKEVNEIIRKITKKYINENLYLFSTDDIYTIHCHLKPRLISGAVEACCSECYKLKLLKDCDEDYLRNLSMVSSMYALRYIDIKQKSDPQGGKKDVL